LQQRDRLVVTRQRARRITLGIGDVHQHRAPRPQRHGIIGHLGEHGVDQRERAGRIGRGERPCASEPVVAVLEPAHAAHTVILRALSAVAAGGA